MRSKGGDNTPRGLKRRRKKVAQEDTPIAKTRGGIGPVALSVPMSPPLKTSTVTRKRL